MTTTRAETRRQNLMFLLEQYETIANLNVVLGRKRNDSTLSQIKNKAKISGSDNCRAMGTALARDIEAKLNLPSGWMDKIHEEIQPMGESMRGGVIDSEFRILSSIPLYELNIADQSGLMKPQLKGEIQLSNSFIGNLIHSKSSKIEGVVCSDSAMYTTLPTNSIALIDRKIDFFEDDGLYLVETNRTQKFRKISQLVDGRYVIKSDLNQETIPELKYIGILGKVIHIWESKKVY